ncbi:leucine-rich repeat-containing protein 74B-like isoform X2 [Ruditapes philippinarum]|uniref:leucine-rich repeat-containing protein 74B-like isoform X2 n=1 Tax=Ruditapes philippinarum TaxID=129788 RepID=UPI00295B3D25|nr:leucine-rich repeat-containing protein 74B-like isoform X2 [Ruditapes philippinarum]
MINEDTKRPLFSRKTTRVAVESPMKAPHKTAGAHHLGLTVPARVTGSRLSRVSHKHFDPEDDYIFDSTDDEEETAKPKDDHVNQLNRGAVVYKKLCKKYGKIPVKNVTKQFGEGSISLKGFNLSKKEIKALFVALLEFYVNREGGEPNGHETDELEKLDLGGNKLCRRQMTYLTDFAALHRSLVKLSLVGCNLCCRSLQDLANFLSKNRTIRQIDLSDNNFTDNGGQSISQIIENSETILELALRGNKLAECGKEIGEALRSNDTLRALDLSWNHIRGNGAIGLCKGVQANKGLETLLLSWNGFGFEGCTAMGYALKENTTLQALDLANNRIHPPALFELIKGLEQNKALAVLKLCHNPITASMTSVLLTKLYQAKESNIKELDLTGLVVDKEFEKILKEVQASRFMVVTYDHSLPLNKGEIKNTDPKNVFNIDPIRILFYMKEHLRTLDLFLKVDRDGSNSLSRDEMKFAFEREGFPISERALDSVMNYLDVNKDGEVDFLEFINGERRLKRDLIKEHEDEIIAEKEQDQKYSQVFTTKKNKTPRKLPPLNGPKMG